MTVHLCYTIMEVLFTNFRTVALQLYNRIQNQICAVVSTVRCMVHMVINFTIFQNLAEVILFKELCNGSMEGHVDLILKLLYFTRFFTNTCVILLKFLHTFNDTLRSFSTRLIA